MVEGVREFQFHKGTIKTTKGAQHISPDRDFNSIKVRLKHRFSITNTFD